MAYIDGAYLIAKYPQVIESLGGYPSDQIDTAIQEATDEVDLYITKWLPLIVLPTFLKSLTADIAIYRAKQDEVTDVDIERYREALDKLKEIRDGSLSLAQVKSGNQQECSSSNSYGNSYFSGIDNEAY